MEHAGAAIYTNFVAEIIRGVPPRGATWHKSPDGMPAPRQWIGHVRGVTPGHYGHVRALEKLEIVPYYVSRTGPSRRSSRSTKITPASERRVSRRGREYEPPPMYDHLHSGARKAKKRCSQNS